MAFVSIPAFAHRRMRPALLTGGRMPVTQGLPYALHDTPNIHMCSVRDFAELADSLGVKIERTVSLHGTTTRDVKPFSMMANLLSEQVIFLIAAR